MAKKPTFRPAKIVTPARKPLPKKPAKPAAPVRLTPNGKMTEKKLAALRRKKDGKVVFLMAVKFKDAVELPGDLQSYLDEQAGRAVLPSDAHFLNDVEYKLTGAVNGVMTIQVTADVQLEDPTDVPAEEPEAVEAAPPEPINPIAPVPIPPPPPPAEPGTEGQDRKSYTDDQDRDSYVPADEPAGTPKVTATITSDDGKLTADFDIAEFLELMDEDELHELEEDPLGEETAENLAEKAAEKIPAVDEVLSHVDTVNEDVAEGDPTVGYKLTVNRTELAAWRASRKKDPATTTDPSTE